MTKLKELNRLGQSIWYDNIRHALIDSGELQHLISGGVTPRHFTMSIDGLCAFI